MFLTPEQTGGPLIFSLRQSNCYLAIEYRIGTALVGTGKMREFDIRELALALGRPAGETWEGHEKVILLACVDGKLFEHLDSGGE